MTLSVDCFWSFRSPYSYLATPRMRDWSARYDLNINVRVVYPLAIRVDGFFKNQHSQWLPYLARDCAREAQRLRIPFARPNPDPVLMNMATGEVPAEQPYIRWLTRLGAAAAEAGIGLPFIAEVGRIIWSGEVSGWHEGPHLAAAAARAGVNLDLLNAAIVADTERYERSIQDNQIAHASAGHWGVPLFVFEGEPFFGQDRMEALLWRLQLRGLKDRIESTATQEAAP